MAKFGTLKVYPAFALQTTTGMDMHVSPVLKVKYGVIFQIAAVVPLVKTGTVSRACLAQVADLGTHLLIAVNVLEDSTGTALTVSIARMDQTGTVLAVSLALLVKCGTQQMLFANAHQEHSGMEQPVLLLVLQE